MSQEIHIIIDSGKPIICENCNNSIHIHMKDKSTDDYCNTIIISNRTDSSNVMLPASTINGEGENQITVISSLEDADIFVNSRIRSDGTFNCYLGEEIVIDDTVWQVVGVDTELGKGDIPLTRHHITLVPKTNLLNSAIHSINADCHGYANSDMYRYVIPLIVAKLEHVLGDHLLTRRVKLTNATSSGTSPRGYMASGTGYYTVKANLLSQMQVFGTINSKYGNEFELFDDTEQLPGFKTNKVAKGSDSWYWLRDVYGYYSSNGAFSFGNVYTDGSLYHNAVYNSGGGVRPLITVG